jgi:hypothetical protein
MASAGFEPANSLDHRSCSEWQKQSHALKYLPIPTQDYSESYQKSTIAIQAVQ